MAATPMAMPSADKLARSLRVRSPTLATRARSAGVIRRDPVRAVAVTGSPPFRLAVAGGGMAAGGGAAAAGRAVSLMICPSSISSWRGMRAAMAWSWVTTAMVAPSACSSSIRARMDWPVALSRLPVGSSASTIAGRPASARAIPTRWRSPPDSWVGRAVSLWPRPTRSSASAARCRRCGDPDPGVQQPVGHVVQHGGVLGEEGLLEHEADPGRPQPGQLMVGHRAPRPAR